MITKLTNEELLERLKPKTGKLKIVIDSDAFNEVDDQFAIAWALKSTNRVCVEAIYAVPFSHQTFSQLTVSNQLKPMLKGMVENAKGTAEGMEQSYQEILNLCNLLNIDVKQKVFRGSPDFLQDKYQPVESEAARDLINRVMQSNELIYVIAIGALTNIASAILMEPSIVNNMVVIWLGGQPLEFGHGIEFNMMEDVLATQVVFDSRVPLVMIPCMNVASHLSVSREELELNLKGKSKVGSYLSDIVTQNFGAKEMYNFMIPFYRHTYLKDCDDYEEEDIKMFSSGDVAWSRIIWDISAIAYLLNPNWVLTKVVPTPILRADLSYEIDVNRHPMRVATYAFRDTIFGNLFASLRDEEIL